MAVLKKNKDSRDHGWAWVVLFSGVLANLIMWGSCYNVGILNVLFLDALRDSRGKTAWIGAVYTCLISMLGPVSSMFVNKIGFRWTIILGGALTSAGSIISYFATDVVHLILSLGVLGGFGLGLCYTPVISVVTLYFDKYQIMATALSSVGSGIGTILFAPLLQTLADSFDWRGTMLILGGVQLHLCLCGALIRPVPDTVLNSLVSVEMDNEESTVRRSNRLFEFEVLKNPKILIFMCNILFINLGEFIVYLHLSAYAIEMRTSVMGAAMLLGIVGIASILSRILLPAAATDKRAGVLMIYACSLGVTGIIVLLSPVLMPTFGGQVFVAFMFGFYGNGYVPLMTPLAVEFVGLELLTAACGVVNLTSGIGTLLGPPLAGFIFDSTGNYQNGFYLAGIMLVLSCLIMLSVPVISSGNCSRTKSVGITEITEENVGAGDEAAVPFKESIYHTKSEKHMMFASTNNIYASALIMKYVLSKRSLNRSSDDVIVKRKQSRTRTTSVCSTQSHVISKAHHMFSELASSRDRAQTMCKLSVDRAGTGRSVLFLRSAFW